MVPQIKKILYATDLSKNSAYAFYFAADLAQSHGAKIIILHCIPKVTPYAYLASGFTDKPIPLLLQEAKEKEGQEDIVEIRKRLEEFGRNAESRFGVGADLVSEIIVKEGYAVEEIPKVAHEKGCDVIVLGARGKGWLRSAFLGSVARSVLERARKPVFVIPLPSDKANIDRDSVQGIRAAG